MSQKTDNLIKLALVFFVSLLSFSIGTYVGKKYSDNQHKLALLEPKKETPVAAVNHQEFDSENQDAEKSIPTGNLDDIPTAVSEKPAALTDSEVAKIAEEFASEEEATEEKIVTSIDPEEKAVTKIDTPTKAVTKTAPAKVAAPVVAKAQTAPQIVEKKVLPKSEPKIVASETITPSATDNANVEVEAEDEVRQPASLQPKQDVVPLHYTVQIGSFPSENEAEILTKNLQSKGFKTSYIPARVNGQVWFRVNVGLFGTIKEAQDYKKEFLDKTKMSSAIVQRVQQ